MRRPAGHSETRHAPTVGILLCADGAKDGVVRYALRSANAPMAIATYTYDTLPPDEQATLPPADAIAAAFGGVGELTAAAQITRTGSVTDETAGGIAGFGSLNEDHDPPDTGPTPIDPDSGGGR